MQYKSQTTYKQLNDARYLPWR